VKRIEDLGHLLRGNPNAIPQDLPAESRCEFTDMFYQGILFATCRLLAKSACNLTDDVMSGSEWQSMRSDQTVGKFCQSNFTSGAPRQSLGLIDLHGGQNFRKEAEHPLTVLECVAHRRLNVILGVDNVAEGRIVKTPNDSLALSQGAAGEDTQMLQSNGVPLLWHDAAALHKSICQPNHLRILRTPGKQVLNKSSQIGHEDGDCRDAFDQVVDACNRTVSVSEGG
jgi:hypothetical protein